MENVKYIPGDLVMMDNQHPYAQKGAVYVVRRADWFDCGKDYFNNKRPYKASYILIEYNYLIKGYDPNCIGAKQFGVPSIYVEPIPLTPEILEKNGWEKNEYGIYYKLVDSKHIVCLIKEKDDRWNVSVGAVTLAYCKSIHEFQHLLFGLGLNSELKV